MPAPEDTGSEPLLQFDDQQQFERWLEAHCTSSAPVWLKIAKRGSPQATVTQAQAVESALCFGWIDGQVGRVDEHYFRQRFSHRRARSKWSQVNVRRAGELIDQGRMRAEGFAEIDRAKADGRWQAAYPAQSQAVVPEDFRLALAANPQAEAFFATLTGVKRYSFLYRIHDAKRPQTRAARIEKFVQMLADHQTTV